MKRTLMMVGAAALACALPAAGTARTQPSGELMKGLGCADRQARQGNQASRQTSRTGKQSQRQTARSDTADKRIESRSDIANDRTDARADFAQDNWRGYYAARPVGYRVNVLPTSYTRVVVAGSPYYYHSGIYYTSVVGGYVVVAAPVGARLAILPAGYRAVVWQGSTYYYVNNTYYVLDPATKAYVVVRKPAGIVVVK